MKLDVIKLDGGKAGSVDLGDEIFGLEPRADILYRVVRWQRNKAQAGTHKVKTRSETSYSTKKIYRQKGTGGARHGDRNAPIFRNVAGYHQNDDLPGIIPGSPWEAEYHATVLRTKCMSCGVFCMMYTIMIYHDNWINVWSNREPYGASSWSTTVTPAELDTIRQYVVSCLDDKDMVTEYEAEDIFDNPDQPHCEFHFRAYGRDREVQIYGGEPPVITETLNAVMRILKRHGWEPTPYVEE